MCTAQAGPLSASKMLFLGRKKNVLDTIPAEYKYAQTILFCLLLLFHIFFPTGVSRVGRCSGDLEYYVGQKSRGSHAYRFYI